MQYDVGLFYYKYTHAIEEKRRLGNNSSNFYSLHEIHEEIEDERKQITHVHILLTQGKEEGGTRDVLQRHTHICIDINTQKEGSSSSILSNSYSFVNLQYVFGFSPNSYVEPYVWLISFTTQSTMNLFVTQYFISHYLVMVNLIQFI